MSVSNQGRIFNFSAGPATMPIEVLEKAQKDIINFRNTGIGVMELSHRSAAFGDIIAEAESSLRNLLNINDDYSVLFVPGGATTQFAAIAMNLLGAGQTADYVITGAWSKKAYDEASKFGEVSVAASSEDKAFNYIPSELSLSENSAYVHITGNNTIAGTQFHSEPEVGERVLISDASSDLLHKPIDVTKYGLIYAGAQKNIGPAGVTIVIIRNDLQERIPEGLPVMLDYRTHISKKSVYNTPPTFPIYVVGEVLKKLEADGGLSAAAEKNERKAKKLYDELGSNDFYKPFAEASSRSLMNVTFRLTNEDLEPKFIEEASAAGLDGLKGHRLVGGIRASIYNAFPEEGVDALISFMQKFASDNS